MGIVDDLHGRVSYPPSKARYRAKGDFTTISSNFVERDRDCTFGQNYAPRNVAVVGEKLQTWDMLTPNYHQRSRNGEFITNPFRSLLETQTTEGSFALVERIANSCESPVKKQQYDYPGPEAYWRVNAFEPSLRVMRTSLLSDGDIASAQVVAATQAWEKSNFHSADVLVDIAEIGQTLRMLRDPIQSSSALLRKIKLGEKGIKNLKSTDAIAYANSLWLQYRYGIRPLVKSVQGVVKALESVQTKRRRTSRGSYTLSKTDVVTGTKTGNPSFSYTLTHKDDVTIRTGLVLEELLTVGRELGVDAAGMLQLPWEAVPLSFVADWFANMNNFLGALAPYLTKTPLSSWTTTWRTQSTVFMVTGSTPTVGWNIVRAPNEYRTGTFVEKVRQPVLQGPKLTWRPQAFQKVSNDQRVVDMFALVFAQFQRVFRV